MPVHHIHSSKELHEKIAKGPSIVDCFATWCGPCKMISPKFEHFSDQYQSVQFLKFDVDEVEELAAELGIQAMPTFVAFKDGKEVNRVMGANPSAIEAAIKQLA
jgi:thioredoxin 1